MLELQIFQQVNSAETDVRCCQGVSVYHAGVEVENIHKFLSTLGVQRLTECLRIMPQTELYKPCPALQAYVRRVVPWIQKQLYSEFSDTYNFLVDTGIKARLASMRFAEVCSAAYLSLICCDLWLVFLVIAVAFILLCTVCLCACVYTLLYITTSFDIKLSHFAQ